MLKNTGIAWNKNQPLFPESNRYIVMDVETMNSYQDIIEIGIVEIMGNKINQKLKIRVKPLNTNINPHCAAVHGITLNDVKFEKTFKEISSGLTNFIGNSPILAHNRAAEYKSLLFEYNQINKNFPFKIDNFYCTMKMAKSLGLSGKLREMSSQLGIDVSHLKIEHDALSDALMAGELFIAMKHLKFNNRWKV